MSYHFAFSYCSRGSHHYITANTQPQTFVPWLCSGHWSKAFKWASSFDFQDNTTKTGFINILPIEGNGSSEWLSNLPMISQHLSGEVGVWTRAAQLQGLCPEIDLAPLSFWMTVLDWMPLPGPISNGHKDRVCPLAPWPVEGGGDRRGTEIPPEWRFCLFVPWHIHCLEQCLKCCWHSGGLLNEWNPATWTYSAKQRKRCSLIRVIYDHLTLQIKITFLCKGLLFTGLIQEPHQWWPQGWGSAQGDARGWHCLVTKSCLTLLRPYWCQASLSMGFPKQEHWSGLPSPSPGDLPDPGSKPTCPALAGGFFTTEPPGPA